MDTHSEARAREQWLIARHRAPDGWPRIGGSEVAAVLGWSKRKDPIDLCREKREPAPPPDERPRNDAKSGIFLEPGILRWYEHDTGRAVVGSSSVMLAWQVLDGRAGAGELARDRWSGWLDENPLLVELAEHLRRFVTVVLDDGRRVVFANRTRPWAVATIDSFAHDPVNGWGVIDAKNLSVIKRDEWRGRRIPAEKLAQVLHYCDVLGLPWGGFATVIGGQDLLVPDVLVSDVLDVQTTISVEVDHFVQLVMDGIPPAAAASEASARALARLYTEPEPGTAAAWVGPRTMADGQTFDPVSFDLEWLTLASRAKATTERRHALEAVIREIAGPREEVILPTGARYLLTPANGVAKKGGTVRRLDRDPAKAGRHSDLVPGSCLARSSSP